MNYIIKKENGKFYSGARLPQIDIFGRKKDPVFKRVNIEGKLNPNTLRKIVKNIECIPLAPPCDFFEDALLQINNFTRTQNKSTFSEFYARTGTRLDPENLAPVPLHAHSTQDRSFQEMKLKKPEIILEPDIDIKDDGSIEKEFFECKGYTFDSNETLTFIFHNKKINEILSLTPYSLNTKSLLTIADLKFWTANFPGKKIDNPKAINYLITRCYEKGRYSTLNPKFL